MTVDFYDPNEDIFGSGVVTPDINEQSVKGTLKYIPVIFIVDCSRSMEDEGRIGSVNSALKALKFKLTEIKSKNNLDLKIAIMTFTSSARWEVGLTPVEEYVFENFSTRAGLTQYSAVFHELNKVLTSDDFMKHTGKCAPPAIMFLTDGEPCDDYSHELNELLKNGWFTNASRSAVLFGDAINSDGAKEALGRFVKDPKKDIVSVDDSTVIIEKIEVATMKTIVGDPVNDEDSKDGNSEDGYPIEDGNSQDDTGSSSSPFNDQPVENRNPFDDSNTDFI